MKLEKRSLVSIAEELGEDRTEITKALYALKEEGRALQAEESEGIFWSLPTPKKEIVEQSANEEPREASTQYPTVLWLNPDDIIIDAGTQSRLKEDEERIDDYKRDMDLGEWDYERRPLPKVAINPDDGRYYAVDCHHRLKAGLLASSCSQMLFEVEPATLPQARLWSTAANTQHGLGADNTPAGVRKRIEMFLDNIELLSPEQYREEFEKVPDLSEQERRIGRFSDRTITRYLRLRPTQSRTVGNIRKEREMGEQFAHLELEEGVSRIEVVAENPNYPIGSLGLVMQLDKKSGIWVKWDKDGTVWTIHPNLITKTDKPKPLTVGVGSTTPQTQTSKRTSIASYFDPPGKTDSVFPDLKGETPDKGSPETVTPAQEQTSTTPAEYAKASKLLEVQDAALKLAKLSPEQLSEVINLLADMGLSERHFNAIATSSQNILEDTVRVAV